MVAGAASGLGTESPVTDPMTKAVVECSGGSQPCTVSVEIAPQEIGGQLGPGQAICKDACAQTSPIPGLLLAERAEYEKNQSRRFELTLQQKQLEWPKERL